MSAYNDYREFCGLGKAKRFEDLSNEIRRPDVLARLSKLYR